MKYRLGFKKILSRLKNNFVQMKGCCLSRKSINAAYEEILSCLESLNLVFVENALDKSIVEEQETVASQTFHIDGSLQPTLKVIVDRM